jgi:hypothetical protein
MVLSTIWDTLGSRRFVREAVVATLVGIVLLLGYVGYGMYATSREQKAHRAFAEGVELFEQALSAQGSQEPETKQKMRWQEAEAAFKIGYKQYSSSRLAPFFLAFQSEASLHLGEVAQAIALLDAMLSTLGKSSPFYGPYAIKRALIQLDQSDAAEQKKGLESLKKLADDASLSSQDLALYHLGEYYNGHGSPALAQEAWKKLRDIGKDTKPPMPSPWADFVVRRLEA